MKKTDKIVVRDGAGRREFIRTGAALLLAGSASVAHSQETEALQVDCDRRGMGEEKNPEISGHDSDSGATADRPGCGRKKPPAMTRYNQKPDATTRVAKVKV